MKNESVNILLPLVLNLDLKVENLVESVYKQVLAKLEASVASLSNELSILKTIIDRQVDSNETDSNKQISSELLHHIVFDLCLPVLYQTQTVDNELMNETCELIASCLSTLGAGEHDKVFLICITSLNDYINASKYGFDLTAVDPTTCSSLRPVCALTTFTHLIRSNMYLVNHKHVDELLTTVKNVLCCCNEQFGVMVLNLVVSEVLKNESDDNAKQQWLQMLMEVLFHFSYEHQDCSMNQNNVGFLILTYLWEQIKNILDREFVKDFLQCSQLWLIIQHGLIHHDSMNRKRATHFLQEIVQCLRTEKLSFTTETSIFYWSNEADTCKLWSTYLLVLDTLEERQVHVIKPLLPRIEDLIFKGHVNSNEMVQDGQSLHLSWIIVLYEKMLMHDSRTIKRWGLEKFLTTKFSEAELKIFQVTTFLHQSVLKTMTDLSLFAFNDQEDKTSCPLVALYFEVFLQHSSEILKCNESKVHFFSELLQSLTAKTWNSVSLLYVSRALSLVPHQRVWGKNSIELLKNFICNALKTQDVYLRASIQCFLLKALLRLIDPGDVTFVDVGDVLSVFSCDCLWRGSTLWQMMITWLKEVTGYDEEISAINNLSKRAALSTCHKLVQDVTHTKPDQSELKRLGLKASARLLILFYDAGIIEDETATDAFATFNNIFMPLTMLLSSINSRPYLESSSKHHCINFFALLLEELSPVSKYNSGSNEAKMLSNYLILHLVKPVAKEILQFALWFIPYQVQVESLNNFLMFIDVIEKLTKILPCQGFFWQSIYQLSEVCQNALTSATNPKAEPVNQMQKYAAMKCLALICKCTKGILAQSQLNVCLMKFIRKEILSDSFHQSLQKYTSTRDSLQQNQWGRIASDYLCCIWQCIYFYSVEHPAVLKASDLAVRALEALNVSADITGILCKCLAPVLSQLMDENIELAVNVMDCLWKAIFERRKCDAFWTSLNEFVKLLFQRKVMIHSHIQVLHNYITEACLLSDNSPAIFHVVFTHCCEIWKDGTKLGMKEHLVIIKNALIFGSVQRKDQRIQYDAASYVNSMKEKYLPTGMFERYCIDDTKIRAMATVLILTLSAENDEEIAKELLMLLLQEDKMLNQQHSRYFGNSLIHRVKSRIWQSILLLEHLLSKETKILVLELVFEELMKEGTQPSVRLLQEWVAVRILWKIHEVRETLWDAMNKAPTMRIASTASFLAILAHLGRILDKSEQEEFILKALSQIVLWCMTHNFTVRVTAQASFMLLWQVVKDDNIKRVKLSYEIFGECLTSSLQYGNTSKATSKLLHDFYFSCFHCDKHYTLETIFKEFPRLTALPVEEQISSTMIKDIFLNYQVSATFISFTNHDDELTKLNASWFTDTQVCAAAAPLNEINNYDYQKKLTPWKQVLLEECSISLPQTLLKKSQDEGLIVVASILDRMPNLGGLCRTCEIFGASELIISNMKFIEDKQFQNLSVSSEQWVTIKEVKQYQLSDYLQSMRFKGYTLTGVEQTAYSRKLHEYKFPKKTLLLLGNEKEGIPVELIHLLDVCIEIPQQGIVRSLNVHVSGAVTIWEYARQHQFY